MEKRMFEDVRVGDRVFHNRTGWETVKEVNKDFFYITEQCIRVNKDGKIVAYDVLPSVFWEKPKMEYSMERPFNLEEEMKKLKVKEWEYGVRNAFLVYWRNYKKIKVDTANIFKQIGVIYFENNDKLKEFENKIKDIEILINAEGIQNTKYIIQEELGELQKEISKDLRGKLNKEHLLEELADVVIVTAMAKFIYNVSDEELQEWINKKMKRNLERNGF